MRVEVSALGWNVEHVDWRSATREVRPKLPSTRRQAEGPVAVATGEGTEGGL